MLPHILKEKNVEKLAILISCDDEEQLIGVPLSENNRGITLSRAAHSEVMGA